MSAHARHVVPLGHLNRRWFLTASVAAVALPGLGRNAWALATGTETFAQGSVEVTVLSDGNLVLPKAILAPSAPPEELDALLAAAYGSVPLSISVAANVTLLKSGADLILVDNGSGTRFQPTAGKILENLAANGIDPAAITKMLITHAHPDHVWGTVKDDGTLAFPNAEYFVGETEYNFWMDPAIFTKLPADYHPFAKGAQVNLGAMKDRLTLMRNGHSVASGVSVTDTPGHTPGHMSVIVEGDGGLVLTGDVIAIRPIAMAHPEWPFGFDADGATAVKTRMALLDRIVTDKMRMLSYHFPYPGTGHVERSGEVFAFTPDA